MWELDHKEGWELKNWCFRTEVLEKTLDSPLDIKEIKPVNPKRSTPQNIHWKDWCWSWSSNTSAIWCEESTHWKRPNSLEKTLMPVKIEGKRRKGWQRTRWLDGITTQWTGVRANFETWWKTGKPRVLRSMGSQIDRTERLNNNNEIEQTQNNFRDKIIKIGYYKQWKKIKN